MSTLHLRVCAGAVWMKQPMNLLKSPAMTMHYECENYKVLRVLGCEI